MYGAMGMAGFNPDPETTLVLNQKNALIAHILDHPMDDRSAALAQQVYDLARLSHAPLTAEQLTAFLARSQELLLGLI